MSNRHSRPPRTSVRDSGGKWIVSAVALAAVGVLVLARMQVFQMEGCHSSVQTSQATILNSRIARAGTVDTYYGGSILYRIEVLARFSQNGVSQTRWIFASDPSSDRATLQLRILNFPQHCIAYWPVNRPDSVRCTFH
jgi:hypothetical protein